MDTPLFMLTTIVISRDMVGNFLLSSVPLDVPWTL